ncbi:MAG: protein-export chaperone SecB [Chitinophagaceae bacterium]
MEVKKQPRLGFLGFDILRVDFKSIAPLNDDAETEMSVTAKVFYPENSEANFSILMNVEISFEESFNLSVQGVGNFVVRGEEIDSEIRGGFVNANAPAIIFPYMRAFIATLTANCGKSTSLLTIPTQFFKGDLEEYISPNIQKQIPFEDEEE